jgi:hypothetical protein
MVVEDNSPTTQVKSPNTPYTDLGSLISGIFRRQKGLDLQLGCADLLANWRFAAKGSVVCSEFITYTGTEFCNMFNKMSK